MSTQIHKTLFTPSCQKLWLSNLGSNSYQGSYGSEFSIQCGERVGVFVIHPGLSAIKDVRDLGHNLLPHRTCSNTQAPSTACSQDAIVVAMAGFAATTDMSQCGVVYVLSQDQCGEIWSHSDWCRQKPRSFIVVQSKQGLGHLTGY